MKLGNPGLNEQNRRTLKLKVNRVGCAKAVSDGYQSFSLIRLVVFLVAALTVFSNTSNVSASDDSVSLRIDGTFSLTDSTGHQTHWTDFATYTSGIKYQTLNTYFNDQQLESCSNGTNAYFVNLMTAAIRAATNWWEWADVSPGRFPRKDLTPGQLCWIAFSSAEYFQTNPPPELPLEAFQQNADMLHCEVRISTNRPYLPICIKWYGSNFWYLRTTNISDKMIVPYTNGYLAAEYYVTSLTNLDGYEFPLGFDLSVYIPFFVGTNLPNTEVSLIQVLKGRVNSIKSVDELEDYRPKLALHAQIDDFRIPRLANGAYMRITRLNGKWPEPNDTDFRRTFDAAKTTISAESGGESHNAIKAVIVIFIVVSLVIVIALQKQQKIQDEKNNS